jgi:hypothetical protein
VLLRERVSRAVRIIYKIMKKRVFESGEYTNKVVVSPHEYVVKLSALRLDSL